MFSCMRQSEVAQVHVSDIMDVEGVLCFDVNANTADKKVKTKAAYERDLFVIPNHTNIERIVLA